jgi:hypothetical protein
MASPLWESMNCYLVLGVPPTASPQEIKSAWRAASRRHHPDLGGSHDAMVRVNTANDVLGDPVSRVAHDMHWKVGAGASPGFHRPPRSASQTSPTTAGTPQRAAHGPGEPTPRARQGTAGAEPLRNVRERVRKRVQQEADRIRAEVHARAQKIAAEYFRAVGEARRNLAYSFAGFAACSLLGVLFRPALLGSAIAGFVFIGTLGGPRIGRHGRSPVLPCTRWAREQANEAAVEATEREVVGLDRYLSDLASLVDLVLRSSTFDDSESQVARRITTAFFLLGYLPVEYSGAERTLVFTDGDERILVRFRHREGAAVNVTIPQKLATLMRHLGIARGYLFCSPGLSGNAATFAAEHNIRAYTIETMNSWIDETLSADYGGPEGDMLAHLDSLKTFLASLSRALPEHSPRRSEPRRRRRRRYW